MTCHDTRERLSDLLDEALDRDPRAEVEAHLAECAECRLELERLRATVGLLHRVEAPRAPVGFVDRVTARARPVPWYRRLGAWLFLPLAVKLPAEAAAVALVAVLVVVLWERTPEIREAARMEPPSAPPSAETPRSAPSPAPPSAETPRQAPLSPAPPASVPSSRVAAPAAPVTAREKPAGAPRDEVATAQATPPAAAPAVAEPVAPAVSDRAAPAAKAEGVEARPRIEAAPAPPGVGFSVPPPATALPSLSAPPQGPAPGGRADRSEESLRKVAPRAVMSAARSAAPLASVVGRLAVKDRAVALASLADLVASVGGREAARQEDALAVVVEVLVPEERYEALVRGLEALGSWSAAGRPSVVPGQPPQVRIGIRVVQ